MNKKDELKKLALIGLSAGLAFSHPLHGAEKASDKNASTEKSKEDPNDGNMNYHLMSESELLLELDSNGTAMYNSLTPEGKALALKVASMMCAGTNLCQGLNACKTSKNDCAGKGACKGQGKCGISDKNLAVRLVFDKMNAKRMNAAKPSS